MKRKKGNALLTPDQFTKLVLKSLHRRADKAVKLGVDRDKFMMMAVMSLAGALNDGPMRMGK